MTSIYDFKPEKLRGGEATLEDHRGEVLLIVNTASKCKFTPQYEGLEALHQRYKDRGLRVMGFPCNQFGHQEPGNEDDIGSFCQVNYGVSFDMFKKIDVNGNAAAPLFTYLKEAAPGALGTKAIKWNFTKFLVGADGKSIERFAPATAPSKLEGAIEKLLPKT